jgi:hypothetical protein
MREGSGGKKGNLAVVRGGVSLPMRGRRIGRRPGPRVLSDAERQLERDMREVFVLLKNPSGTTPSRGVYAICSGDATPWRALGLRVLESLEHRCAPARVRAIGERFLAWIDQQIAAREFPRAA